MLNAAAASFVSKQTKKNQHVIENFSLNTIQYDTGMHDTQTHTHTYNSKALNGNYVTAGIIIFGGDNVAL